MFYFVWICVLVFFLLFFFVYGGRVYTGVWAGRCISFRLVSLFLCLGGCVLSVYIPDR